MEDPVVTLRAIADPVRWKALTYLRDPGETRACCEPQQGVCACDLEHVLGVSQPTVSHHMKLLVDAGLVRAERRSRWVFYEIDTDAFDALRREFERFVEPPSA